MFTNFYSKVCFVFVSFIIFVNHADAMEQHKREREEESAPVFKRPTNPSKKRRKVEKEEQEESKIEEKTIEDLPYGFKLTTFYNVALSKEEGKNPLCTLSLVCKEWKNIASDSQLLKMLVSHRLSQTSMEVFNKIPNHLEFSEDGQDFWFRLYNVEGKKKTRAIRSCMELLKESFDKSNLTEERNKNCHPILILKIFDLFQNKKSIISVVKKEEDFTNFKSFMKHMDYFAQKLCETLHEVWSLDRSNQNLWEEIFLFTNHTFDFYRHLADDSFCSKRTEVLLKRKVIKFPHYIQDSTVLKFYQFSGPFFNALEGPYILDRATGSSVSNNRKNAVLRKIWETSNVGKSVLEPEVIENYNEIIRYYTPLATEGDLRAVFTLASICRLLDRQPAALELLRVAARGDLPEAQFCLGALLAEKDDLESPSHEEALVWRKKAAANGVEGAYLEVGLQYMQGIGTPVDVDQAKQNFEKAIETDQDGLAEFELYFVHMETDPQIARDYLERSARKKLPKAQYKLGLWYAGLWYGMEGEKDPELLRYAYTLFRSSAKGGCMKAQYQFALYCQAMQNSQRALKWLRNPAAKGYEKAIKAKEKLINAMTSDN